MPIFYINDMTCKHCEATVNQTVKAIDQDAEITIDLSQHTATIQSTTAVSTLEKAIRDAGFHPVVQL